MAFCMQTTLQPAVVLSALGRFCAPPASTAPAFPSLGGSLLACVASDVPCQPCVSRALIRSPAEPPCAATQLQAFFTAGNISAMGGALGVQQLEASSFCCCFAIFLSARVPAKRCLRSPGRRPQVLAAPSAPAAKPCPAAASPLLAVGEADSLRGWFSLNFRTVSSPSVGLTHVKAGLCSHCGGRMG